MAVMLGIGEDPLSIYLNDHLAGSTVGLELARRLADTAGALATVAQEIEEDRATLTTVMERLSVTRDPAKVAISWGAEKAGRLKFAGARLAGPELGRLEELEALALGVEGKLALWQALRATHGSDPRLDGIDLDALIERARSQRRRLERQRIRAAEEALA
jgi:hypothetical protein